MESNGKKGFLIIAAIAVVAIALVFVGINVTKNIGKKQTVVQTEKAADKLKSMINSKKLTLETAAPVTSTIDLLQETSLADELPVLKDEDLSVQGKADIVLEAFASPEKAGTDKEYNGWWIEVAKSFNKQKFEVNGKTCAISVRNVTSGLGVDYMVSGVKMPGIFSPSSKFWGAMAKAQGVDLVLLDDGVAGNVAGIVISNEKYNEVKEKYGTVDLSTISQAVTDDILLFGYTTPNTSSTGLNYIMFDLYGFDAIDPLSDEAIEGFQNFQKNVPVIAQTTMQMQTAAEKGKLDAFVYESQVWENSPTLHKKYKFVPFGIRHDNPVYVPANLTADQKEVAQMFIDYCKQDEWVKLATKYGFNSMNDYVAEDIEFDGATLLGAQQAWKENKDNGKTIIAVFVADMSGSMKGDKYNALQTSLINGMQYIDSKNQIGLVTYNDVVTICCPIAEFDLKQQSLFKGAVENMVAYGGTATINGVIVGLDMLLDAKEKNPDSELMLFILSDGERNTGYTYNDIEELVAQTGIPIYSIGYEDKVPMLDSLSEINEAVKINATSDDVIYKLKNLFNSSL